VSTTAEGATGLTVEELKHIYRNKRREITDRLAEFAEVGREASDERLFEELTFCIYTAGASAKMGLRSVERVRSVFMTGSQKEIEHALERTHMWPEQRAERLYQTREYLSQHCKLRMRELLEGFSSADERRDFFAANPGIRGIGYKEASHFLRNIGYRGYAILDKHILARLAEFEVIESPKPASTKKKYVAIEEKMKGFAQQVRIDFDELDLLLWYTKTGEILK